MFLSFLLLPPGTFHMQIHMNNMFYPHPSLPSHPVKSCLLLCYSMEDVSCLAFCLDWIFFLRHALDKETHTHQPSPTPTPWEISQACNGRAYRGSLLCHCHRTGLRWRLPSATAVTGRNVCNVTHHSQAQVIAMSNGVRRQKKKELMETR